MYIFTCLSPINFYQLVCQSLSSGAGCSKDGCANHWLRTSCSLYVVCLSVLCLLVSHCFLTTYCQVTHFSRSVTHLLVTHGCTPLVGFVTFLLLACLLLACQCYSFIFYLLVCYLVVWFSLLLLTNLSVTHFFHPQFCAAHLFGSYLFVPDLCTSLFLKLTPSLFQFYQKQDLPENHFRVSGVSWVNIIARLINLCATPLFPVVSTLLVCHSFVSYPLVCYTLVVTLLFAVPFGVTQQFVFFLILPHLFLTHLPVILLGTLLLTCLLLTFFVPHLFVTHLFVTLQYVLFLFLPHLFLHFLFSYAFV